MKPFRSLCAKSYLSFLVLSILTSLFIAENSFAADKERAFMLGTGHRKGNEGSILPSKRIRLDGPTYGGNGCPQGTMQVVFAPDNLSFSVLFDSFVAQVPDPERRGNRDRLTCDAIIPIEIPEGMQMEITRVDLRGFIGLPGNAQATLRSVFSFRGRGLLGRDGDRMNLRYKFVGPVMEDYEISSDVIGSGNPVQSEVSPCGGQARLNIFNEVRIQSRSREDASVTIDSIDGAANALYFVNWRECRESGGGKSGGILPPKKSKSAKKGSIFGR